jgi:glyoxylase-like metal-dependent hydrolase (beta-lactamase superfamily II)
MIQVEQYGPVIAIRMARRFMGKPLYWSTAYWMDGLLIDTGPAATAAELVRVLEQVPVTQIALTHAHEDHIGGLGALRKRYPDIPVFAAERALPILQDPTQLQMQLYRRLVWGTPTPVEQIIPLNEVADVVRTPRFTLRAVETPGHSREHVCYFEPQQRWIFSGDAFIAGRDRSWAREYDLLGVIGSLQTLAGLDIERLFPGSGNVRRSPTNDILDKIAYLLQLARDVERLETAGMRAEAIATQFFGKDDDNLAFWTQRQFTALHLVEACRSYNAILRGAAPPRRSASFVNFDEGDEDDITGAPDTDTSSAGPSAGSSTGSSADSSADLGDAIR